MENGVSPAQDKVPPDKSVETFSKNENIDQTLASNESNKGDVKLITEFIKNLILIIVIISMFLVELVSN